MLPNLIKISRFGSVMQVFLLSLQSKSLHMLIGSNKELLELQQAYDSDESTFVAILWRRTIATTYLVSEVFPDQFAFIYSGMVLA